MSTNERVITTSNTPLPQTPAVSASSLSATPRPQLEAQGAPRKFTPLPPVSDELHSRLNALATSSLNAPAVPESVAATSASANTAAHCIERTTAISPAHTPCPVPSAIATAKSDADALKSTVSEHAREESKYLSAFTRATTNAQLAAANAAPAGSTAAAPAALATPALAPAATGARTALPYDHTPAHMEHVQVLQQALSLLQQQLKKQRHATLQAVTAPAASARVAEAQPATPRLPQPQPQTLNPYLPLNAEVDPLKDCPSCLLLALHTSSRAAIARLLSCSRASATTATTPTMAQDAVPPLDVLQTALRCITAQLGTTELTTALHRVLAHDGASESVLALSGVATDLSTRLSSAHGVVSTTMLRATDTMRRAVAKMTVQLAAQFIAQAVAPAATPAPALVPALAPASMEQAAQPTAPAEVLPAHPSTAEGLTNIVRSALQTLFAVVGAPCPQLQQPLPSEAALAAPSQAQPQQLPPVKLTTHVANTLTPQLLIGLTLWLERYESQVPQLTLQSTCDFAVAVPLLAPVEPYRDLQQRAVAILEHAPTEVQHLWYQSQHQLVQHEQQLYAQTALTATQSYQFLALQQAAQAMRPFYHLFCRYEGTVSRPEMALLRLYHLFYEQEASLESAGAGAIIPYQWKSATDDHVPPEYYWFFVDLNMLVDRSQTGRSGFCCDQKLQSLQSGYLNCHLYYDADLFTEWSQKLEPASAQLLSAHELSLLSGFNVMPQLDHSTTANHEFLSAHYSLLHNQGDATNAGMVLELASQMPLTENWQILSGQALKENKTLAAVLQEQDARNKAQQRWLKRRASEERRSHEQARHERCTNFQSQVPLPPLLQGRARPGPQAGVLLPPAPLQPVSIPLSAKQAQLLLLQMQLLKSSPDLTPEELHLACTAIRENCFWRFHQVVGLLGDTLCGLKPYVVDFNPTHELRFINEHKLFFGTKAQSKSGNFLSRQHLLRMSAWWQALRAQQERSVIKQLQKSYPPLFLHISNKHLAEPWKYCQALPASHAASPATASASATAEGKMPVWGNLSLNDGYNQHLYYGGLKVTTGFTLDSADLNAIAGYKQRHTALQQALAFASQSLSHFSAMLLQKQSMPLFFCLEDLLLQSHQPAPIFAHCHTLVALQLETVLSCGLKMSLAAYYTNTSPSWLYRLSKERPCDLAAPDFNHAPDSTIAQMLAQLTLTPTKAPAAATATASSPATTAPKATAPEYSQYYLDEFGHKRLKLAALGASEVATPAPRSGCGTAPSRAQCETQPHEALSALELQSLKSQQPQPVSAPQQWSQQLTARDKSRARAAALAAAATVAQGVSPAVPAAPAAPIPHAANTLTIPPVTPAATTTTAAIAATAAAQATAPRPAPALRAPAGSKHRATSAALCQRHQQQHQQQQSFAPAPSLWQQAYGKAALSSPSLHAPFSAASGLAQDTAGASLRDYSLSPSLSVVTQLQDKPEPVFAEVEPHHAKDAIVVPLPPKPAAPALANHRKRAQQTMGMALTASARATGAAVSTQGGGAAMQTMSGNGGGSVAPAAVFMNSMWPPLGMSHDLDAKQSGALLYAATHRVSSAAPSPATTTTSSRNASTAVRAPTTVLAPAEAKALLRLSTPNQLLPHQQQPQQQTPRQLTRSAAPTAAPITKATITKAATKVAARATAASLRHATMGVTTTLTAMMPHNTTGSLLTANELGLEAEQLHYTTPAELEALANDVHCHEATPPTSKEERLAQITTASVYKGLSSAEPTLASEVAKALRQTSTPHSSSPLKPKEIAALTVQECNDLYTILQVAPLNIMLNTMVNMYFNLLQVHGLLYEETVEFTSSSLEDSTYPAQIELVHQLLLERQEAQLVGSSLAYDYTTHKVRLHLSFLHHDRERKELNLRSMLTGSRRKATQERQHTEQEAALGSAEDSALAGQDTAASQLQPQQQRQLTKLLRTARQQEAFAEVLTALEFFAAQHQLTLEEAAARIGFTELFAQAEKAHLITANGQLHTKRCCSVVAQSAVAMLTGTALSSASAPHRLHANTPAAYRDEVAAISQESALAQTKTPLVPATTTLAGHKAKQQVLRSSNIPSTDELVLFSLPRKSLEARLKAMEAKQRSEQQLQLQQSRATEFATASAYASASASVSASATESASAPAAASIVKAPVATVSGHTSPEQSTVPFTPLHRTALTASPVTDPKVTQALAALKVQVQQRLLHQNLLLASTPLQQEALLDFAQSKGLQSPAELGLLYGLCAALAQTASTARKQQPLLSSWGLSTHRAQYGARCYHARQSLREHFASSELHVHTTHCTPRTGTGTVTPLVATQKRQLQEAMLTWQRLQELGLEPILEAYELNMAGWCEWYLAQRSAEQRLRLADFMALLEKKKGHKAATSKDASTKPVQTAAQSRKAQPQARRQSQAQKARQSHHKLAELNHNLEKLAASWGITKENQQRSHELKISYLEFYTRFLLGCQTGEQGALSSALKGQWVLYQMKNHQRYELWGLTHDCLRFGRTADNDASWDKKSWPQRLLHPEGYHGAIDLFLAAAVYKGVRQLEQTLLFPAQSKRLLLLKNRAPLPEKLLCPSFEVFLYALEALESQEAMWYQCTCGHRNLVFNPYLGHTRLTEQNCEQCATHLVL